MVGSDHSNYNTPYGVVTLSTAVSLSMIALLVYQPFREVGNNERIMQRIDAITVTVYLSTG